MARIGRTAARLVLALAGGVAVILGAGAWPASFFTARAGGQEWGKFNQFVQTSNSPSMKLLREGRDLLDGEDWAKAAAKFDQFISTYPKDKDVDVALYWLAYALKQQGRAREAADRLTRLLSEFPRSNWAEEATAMLTELAPQTGDRQLIDRSLGRDDEEIRIVALQSLFESNPERAMAYVADVLKPGSKASRSFKQAALSLLGSHGERQAVPLLLDIARNQPDDELRLAAVHKLADVGGLAVVEDLVRIYDAERDTEVKQSVLRAFEGVGGPRARAKLLEVARDRGASSELRATAVRVLGDREDGDALEDLVSIYNADADRELKEQILNMFADIEDPRGFARLAEVARNPAGDPDLRRHAVRRLGDREGEAAVDELFRIFEAERDPEVRQEVVRALGHHDSPRARARITEIARARGGDRELRRTAVRILVDDEDHEAAGVELLVGLYDSETDAELKADILRALADTKSRTALRKLLDVARRDPDVDLRKRAVSLLGESDDPEAAKFLEELLRP
ncbi:MAG TPA: HEAT repeat domain-containing protein [Pyrinomonadaceae bacterium]|nr:HEAT repeat domain-containing protein [Pyrinomonadaceae bacterium]